eukprot:m.139405 g.139405  ORF g.139405 m.139405 type:complete len:140 (-) comp14798_c0_seq6:1360-1779(-)
MESFESVQGVIRLQFLRKGSVSANENVDSSEKPHMCVNEKLSVVIRSCVHMEYMFRPTMLGSHANANNQISAYHVDGIIRMLVFYAQQVFSYSMETVLRAKNASKRPVSQAAQLEFVINLHVISLSTFFEVAIFPICSN